MSHRTFVTVGGEKIYDWENGIEQLCDSCDQVIDPALARVHLNVQVQHKDNTGETRDFPPLTFDLHPDPACTKKVGQYITSITRNQ